MSNTSTTEWFRNSTWNSEIESHFDLKLKRTRVAENKAQYLRIQANYLLNSGVADLEEVAIRLLSRLFNDFPTQISEIAGGKEKLGDFYWRQKNSDKAEECYSWVMAYYEKEKTRSGTSGIADLKLAEIFLSSQNGARIEKAYSICSKFPLEYLIFNADVFCYEYLRARICKATGRGEEAKGYAKLALEKARIKEPQFPHHKKIGIPNASENELQILRDILAEEDNTLS